MRRAWCGAVRCAKVGVNMISPLAIVFLVILVDLIGFGIVIPILPLYAHGFGASPLVIGLLLGAYSAMQFLAAPVLGRLSDRVGRRPVLLLSLAGTALGFLFMGMARSLGLLFVARILDGVTGGNLSTAQAYIADVTPPKDRSRRMGLIGAAFGLGFILGPALGGLLGHFSLAMPFLFASGLAGINTLAAALWLPESLPRERRAPREARSLTAMLRGPAHGSMRRIVAAYGLTTGAFSLLTALYPLVTAHRFGYGAMENGVIFAGLGLLSAIVQGGLLGWMLKRASDHRLAMIGMAMLAAGLCLLPLTHAPATLVLATAGLAIGHGLVAAPLSGMASKHAGAAVQGQVMGLLQSAASLARVVGPVAGGWLLMFDAAHPGAAFGRTPYWTAGAVTVSACLVARGIRPARGAAAQPGVLAVAGDTGV